MPLPTGRQAARSPDDARVRQIHASGMRKLSTSGGLTASTKVAIAASVAFSARVTGGRPRRRDHYSAQRGGFLGVDFAAVTELYSLPSSQAPRSRSAASPASSRGRHRSRSPTPRAPVAQRRNLADEPGWAAVRAAAKRLLDARDTCVPDFVLPAPAPHPPPAPPPVLPPLASPTQHAPPPRTNPAAAPPPSPPPPSPRPSPPSRRVDILAANVLHSSAAIAYCQRARNCSK